MQLTEHFSLSEFEYSATAIRHGIDNTIDLSTKQGQTILANLQRLCTEILEPLRAHVNKPIIISSGYRSTELNRLVGGVHNSQHRQGNAADIYYPDPVELLKWFRWLAYNYHDRYLVIYEDGHEKKWIHINYRIKR